MRHGWSKNIWKGNIPYKIRSFCWLAVNDRILTWNNLQKRGILWSECIVHLLLSNLVGNHISLISCIQAWYNNTKDNFPITLCGPLGEVEMPWSMNRN